MKILFAFENRLPSREADAEVFVTTARYIAPLVERALLHVPLAPGVDGPAGVPVVRAFAPGGPAVLRHFCCGVTLVWRRAFREADLVYTRNLWIAWMSLLFGQRVVFDHYRPWPDQIPPLQRWLHWLICRRRFVVNICHSEYTREKYLQLGIPADKLCCVRNGFEPARLLDRAPLTVAKAALGIPAERRTVVYTGRLNHRKGLDLVVAAARLLPDVLFVLVGSVGQGAIETLADGIQNIRIVGWQPAEDLARYVFAADALLIPPSWKPLAQFGSTVLPLKLFFYMASGRPIIAGATPDVREVLRHRENALLCAPDDVSALVGGIRTMFDEAGLAERLAATALADSGAFTWAARAERIMTILHARLGAAATAGRGRWTPVQQRAWARQSRRWLVHLVRNRSFVLPPDAAPDRP